MRPIQELHGNAINQFQHARRRASLERILARLQGRSVALLCFEQVGDRLVPQGNRELGLQEIPLAAIVGSVGRCSDYTLGFMPLKDSDQSRWTRVMDAAAAGRDLPPIRAFHAAEVYFVIDGHHRVSVARLRELTYITAWVVEVQTGTLLDPTH